MTEPRTARSRASDPGGTEPEALPPSRDAGDERGVVGAPRIPRQAVLRERLLQRLSSDAPLHVVRGPAGSGKTVLLAQWAPRASVPGIWITVDREGTDASAFVRSVVLALSATGQLADSGVAQGPSHASLEAALDASGEPWGLLASALPPGRPIQFVVDDADRLDDDTLTALIQLVERTPTLRLVASARRSSPLTAPGVGLTLDTDVVDAAELAFTVAEIDALVERTADARPTGSARPDPAQIAEHTGGLAIGVRAMVLAGDDGGSSAAPPEAALAAIESYYSLRARPGDEERARLRRFLLRTSVAEVLTVELAADLAGDARAADLLDQAEADGLGMWTGHGAERRFAYTTLVRELFRRDLRRTEPGEVDALVRKVAGWSLANDRPFTALAIAVELDDLAFAGDVVRQSWLQLLASHAAQTRELFATTSLLTLRRHPLITMLLALNFNASGLHRARAVQLFGLAILSARAQRAGAAAPDRALLRTMESVSLRVIGRFSGADAAALDAFDILQHMAPAERDELGRLEPVLWAHIGTTFLYTGRTDDALTCFRAGVAAGDALQRPSALTALALLAGTLTITGDIAQAEAVCREARSRAWPPRWIDGYAGSLYQIAEAMIALERSDADTAERHIRTLDRHRETIEHWPLIDHVDAMIAVLRGTPGPALARLDASIRAHRRRSAASSQTLQRLALTRSVLQLAAGDSDAAARSLAGAPRRSAAALVGQARIALTRGDHSGALRLSVLAAREPLSTRLSAEVEVIRLAALLRAGRQAEAREIGDATLAMLADHDLAFPLALVTAGDLAAIREFARLSGRPESQAAVLRPGLRAVLPDQQPLPALTEREQVVLGELLRNGSVAEIAEALSVSPNTVKSQLRSLYRKLGVSTREDAIAVATARDLGAQR